jgi:RNA polymerase sigma factor (sigma-70 family)
VTVELREFLDGELGPLLGFARVLIADRATAEDIVQDVVAKLLARPDRFPAIDNPRAYVRRMVVTEYASWGRKWFRIKPSARIAAEPVATDAAGVVSDRDELRNLLAALPRNQRAVLVMRYYLQLGDAEIAETIGCSEGTVRTHASRGLATLRITGEKTDVRNSDSDWSNRDSAIQ